MDDPELFALSRFPDSKDQPTALVFANFSNWKTRENAFALDPELRVRLDPAKRYQARDLMGGGIALWDPPLTGRELLDQGMFVKLSPYQVQVLELEEVP